MECFPWVSVVFWIAFVHRGVGAVSGISGPGDGTGNESHKVPDYMGLPAKTGKQNLGIRHTLATKF